MERDATPDSRRHHADPAAQPAAEPAIGTDDRLRDRDGDRDRRGDGGDAVDPADQGGGPAMTTGQLEVVSDTDTAGEPG